MNKILTKAIELTGKYDWTRGTYARDAKGNVVSVHSEDACQFCALGFIGRARYELEEDYLGEEFSAEKLVEAHIPEGFSNDIVSFNDCGNVTKQDIIDLFRKANA